MLHFPLTCPVLHGTIKAILTYLLPDIQSGQLSHVCASQAIECVATTLQVEQWYPVHNNVQASKNLGRRECFIACVNQVSFYFRIPSLVYAYRTGSVRKLDILLLTSISFRLSILNIPCGPVFLHLRIHILVSHEAFTCPVKLNHPHLLPPWTWDLFDFNRIAVRVNYYTPTAYANAFSHPDKFGMAS